MVVSTYAPLHLKFVVTYKCRHPKTLSRIFNDVSDHLIFILSNLVQELKSLLTNLYSTSTSLSSLADLDSPLVSPKPDYPYIFVLTEIANFNLIDSKNNDIQSYYLLNSIN